MSEGPPTVSVIVRSMDRPELARALASIAAQDAAGVTAEVVVVAAIGPRHRPIPARVGRFDARLVAREGPLQRPRAGNAGLEAARGRFITFLDDDDELMPGQFRMLLGELAADPKAGLVHARALAVDSQRAPLYVFGGPWIEWRQLTHGFFQLAAVMFRRELLDRGVRFDEHLDILEDLEFFVQCRQVARFRYLAEPVMLSYVMDGTSGTAEEKGRDLSRVQNALAIIREKWRDLGERLDDMTPARIERASELLKAGRAADALAAIEPVLRRAPDDVNALNLGGMARLQLGDLAGAAPLLRRASELVPGHAGLQANVALLERRLKDSG